MPSTNTKYEITEFVTSLNPLEKSSLFGIKSLDGKDFGSYSCQITFDSKVDTIEFEIKNILEKSPIAKINSNQTMDNIETLDMEVGESRLLTCSTNLNKTEINPIEWKILPNQRSMSEFLKIFHYF